MKRIAASLALVAMASNASAMGNRGRLDPQQAKDQLEKALPFLEASAAYNDKAASALDVIKNVTGNNKPVLPSYPDATTNYVERFPDGNQRIITNEVYQVVIPKPITTPIANIVKPSITNNASEAVSNAIPASVTNAPSNAELLEKL